MENNLRIPKRKYICNVNSYLAPTKHPTMLDIAWAAGIVEGEGCFSSSSGTIRISVCQKDKYILSKLKDLFGGNLSYNKYSNCNSWYLTGIRARGFIYTVFSFLSPRRREQFLKHTMLAETKIGKAS